MAGFVQVKPQDAERSVNERWRANISAHFQVNYRNHIALNLATAHPHYDKEGNTYNMGTAIIGLGRPKYVVFKVPADTSGTVKSCATAALLRPFVARVLVVAREQSSFEATIMKTGKKMLLYEIEAISKNKMLV